MAQRALDAIRSAIAHNQTGYHEVGPETFGAPEVAIDGMKGFLGALVREYPTLRFEVRATPDVLRMLGLNAGYLSIGSEMVFVRHGETHVAGYVRIAFAPRT
jgi:hypothetical protein